MAVACSMQLIERISAAISRMHTASFAVVVVGVDDFAVTNMREHGEGRKRNGSVILIVVLIAVVCNY